MNSHKKRKFNTKKGISLVVAIALSAVLVLTTTTFISLALLQQKETGSELNTRQAYVSAKSALDMAKDMIQEGKIDLTGTGPFYYVLYHTSTGVGVQKCADADSAKQFIENTSYTVVGNSYIRITNDGTNYTVSAFSTESKYTADSNDVSFGDLSAKFEATVSYPAVGKPVTLKINEGSIKTKTEPAGGGSRFLLVGGQTNFSLLKSAYKHLNNNNDDADRLQLLSRYHTSNATTVFTPTVETEAYPIVTQFPLVYTEVVKNDTDNNRATYKVFDDGIYYLGCYNGDEIGTGYQYSAPNNVNASYYSNNSAYGTILHCKFLVIEHNMLGKVDPQDANKNCAVEVHPYGSGSLDGIVVFLPNGSTFTRYKVDGSQYSSKTYEAGYYWLPCQKDSGKVDLLDPNNGMKLICSVEEYEKSTDNRLNTIKSKSIYKTLKDTNGNFKEFHSAWEEVSDTGAEPVKILESSGKFIKDSKTYSRGPRSEEDFYKKWDNYSIYCGPFATPEDTGYYDMYCGDTFNYLWYNIIDMTVKNEVKMSIRSNKTVLTIGGDETFEEKAIQTSDSSHKIMKTYMPGETILSGETQVGNEAVASRTIRGEGNAEFWIRPYIGETAFTLDVMNNFTVIYPGDSYIIKSGSYDDIHLTFANGINLFSNEARDYFEAKNDGTIPATPATDSSINWVSSGKIANLAITAPNLTQSDKFVQFNASSGSFPLSAKYSAKGIACEFTHTVETNGAELEAELLSIDTSAIKGDTLYIDTKTGSGTDAKKSHCIVKNTVSGAETTYSEGHLLEIKQDMKLYDNSGSGKEWRTLKKGYYFFKTNADRVNILDINTWTSGTMSIYYAESAGVETPHGLEFGFDDPKTDVKFTEGGYY